MRRPNVVTGCLVVTVSWIAAAGAVAQTPPDAATRSRLGRLLDAAPGTPGQQGLVSVALAEAHTALAQAVRAEQAADDLATMRSAGAAVVHAIDPSRQPTGPGLGYGVTRAVGELLVELQALAGGDNRADVARAAPRALTAALEVQQWAAALAGVAQQLAAAPDLATATTLRPQLRVLAAQILVGPDATAAAARLAPLASGLYAVEARLAPLYLGRVGTLPASLARPGERQP